MDNVVLLPGVGAVPEITEPEIDLEAILAQQGDLLLRWRVLGEELKRRAEYPLPFDLALELQDLINATA